MHRVPNGTPSTPATNLRGRHRSCLRYAPILVAAAMVQPGGLSAQRSTEGYSVPVIRNATPTTAPPPQAPPPGTAYSDTQRLSLVRSTGLDVQGIADHVRLTPREPYAVHAYFNTSGSSSLDSFHAEEGVILLQSIGGRIGKVSSWFRVLQPGAPVLVDFIAESKHGPLPIRLVTFGGQTSEKRVLTKGVNHVAAILVPKTNGWYNLDMLVEEPKYSLWVSAVEITVLD